MNVDCTFTESNDSATMVKGQKKDTVCKKTMTSARDVGYKIFPGTLLVLLKEISATLNNCHCILLPLE